MHLKSQIHRKDPHTCIYYIEFPTIWLEISLISNINSWRIRPVSKLRFGKVYDVHGNGKGKNKY